MDIKDTVILIDRPRLAQEGPKNHVYFLCLNLTNRTWLCQFLICTISVFIFYLAYGYYLELIFANPDVKPINLVITLWQFIITMLLSYGESVVRAPIKRKVPLKTYAIIAALTLGTMVFSNLALSYLNYPTQLIFKSCKLIPVMIGSIIILKKRFGFLDYVAAVFMCVGLTLFTLVDSKLSPHFDFLGVFIICLALLCDAIIGNVQEKAMKKYQASNNEIMFYSYGIGSFYLLVITGCTGVLQQGTIYCLNHARQLFPNVILLSLSGYLGLQAVLTLVRISGATVAVTVTTMRKAVSIIISFILFNKPFDFQYAWSGMLIVFAIYLSHMSKKNPYYKPVFIRGVFTLMGFILFIVIIYGLYTKNSFAYEILSNRNYSSGTLS